MTTGPRPTPYPIVLQVDASGTPTGLGESSSIYVTTVSAVTISATNYLGLGGLSGFPGGDLSSLQFKTGNTTFDGSPFLKYSVQLSGLLANAVSAARVLASNLSATTISATTYLNLPATNLSSLTDVQYSSVSGGQALVYSSSINKWAPGYRIYRSDAAPTVSLGTNGDIYFRHIQDSTNAAYLSSLLDTNINLVSNGQSLIWSSGYWIPSAIPISQGAITSIPSASPIWNAASADGYDIEWGVASLTSPAAFDVVGFSLTPPYKITNFPLALAGPVLVQQAILNNLIDLDVGNAQTNNILTKRSDGYWYGASTINVASISSTNWQGLPSATPTWNANKLQSYNVSISNPVLYDIIGVGAGNTITNVPGVLAAAYFAALTPLSALADVWDSTPAQQNNVLIRNQGYWEPSNSISLSNISTTTISATNWRGLPSATPTWNAASATNYRFDFASLLPQPFDIIGFGEGQIQNFPASSAAAFLSNYINLSSLKDVDNTVATIGDLLVRGATSWGPAAPAVLGAFNLWNANQLQGRNISVSAPSANDVLSYNGSEWKPASAISVSSIVAVSADLSSVKLSKYVEPKSTVTISSSSITLNLNNAQVFEISATSNISSITIQNPDSRSSIVQGFTIIFSADGTQRTVTNWGSIKWSGGTGPTLTATNNKKDILSFISPDNGTNWYGFIGGQNF